MQKYDLAVAGAGLGGLAAAALASRMNKKTIVLEPGDTVGGSLGMFRKKDFFFYPGPSLSFGFERGGPVQQLNESLGIAQNASLRSPCYQVALPDRRITVYAEQSETLDELEREFPQEIDTIAGFYHELSRQAIRNSRSRFSALLSRTRGAGNFLSRYRFSPEFTAFLDVQSAYFFSRPADSLPLLSLISLCDSAPSTVHGGGFRKLAEQIVDVLLRNGGEIRYQVSLGEVSPKTRVLTTSEGPLEADAVLVNMEQSPQSPLLCIGLQEDVVPVGMLPEVFCVPDYAHPGRFFTLSMSAKDDESTAPRGMRTLTGTFRGFPQQPLDGRMQHVRKLLPFLDDFLLFAEEYSPMPRTYGMLKDMSLKMAGNRSLFSRASAKGIYVLFDEAGTPAQSIAAAQRFVERLAR